MDIELLQVVSGLVENITTFGMMSIAILYLEKQAKFWRDKYLEDKDKNSN